MSDRGEDVRRVQTYLHLDSEHWTDWFHITMPVTVLQQQTKSLQGEANLAKEAAGMSKQIDRGEAFAVAGVTSPRLWIGRATCCWTWS
jgi:hypothetical protein